MTAQERIGRNIRQHRKAAKLSLETCALRAEIHPTGMRLYESGERQAKAEILVKLAGASA